MGDVVVVGSLNEDLVVEVQRVPRPGETLLGGAVNRGCGGKGANQAIAAATAGARVRMVGAVGDDEAGARLRSVLAARGIDLAGVVSVTGPTGVAIVAVDADGENAIIVSPGANRECTPEHVTTWLGGLSSGDVVVAQGEIPPDAILHAGRLAARTGARFVLNLAPVVVVDLASTPVHALVVNEHEARELVGHGGEADAETLAARVAEMIEGAVVVTLGPRGALVVDHGVTTRIDAVKVSRVVDTTGAGDAFVGALAAGLASGLDLVEATRWGTAAGSIAVSAIGAQSAGASREAIQAVLNPARPGPGRPEPSTPGGSSSTTTPT